MGIVRGFFIWLHNWATSCHLQCIDHFCIVFPNKVTLFCIRQCRNTDSRASRALPAALHLSSLPLDGKSGGEIWPWDLLRLGSTALGVYWVWGLLGLGSTAAGATALRSIAFGIYCVGCYCAWDLLHLGSTALLPLLSHPQRQLVAKN